MKNQEESQSEDIKKAIDVLRNGGVVIFPTDTVYGLGAKIDANHALARIKYIKKTHQDFPVLVSNIHQAHQLAHFDSQAQHLANRYWPGAMTMILPSKTKHEKIGLRMPDSDLVREIINKVGKPIIGTSANFHSQKAPTNYKELDPNLVKMVDFVVKGHCKQEKESTVIDATFRPPRILRDGAIEIKWT